MEKVEFTQEEQEALKIIGKRLNIYMSNHGFYAKDVAEKTRLRPNTISNIKLGRANVRFLTLYKICSCIGMDMSELMRDITKKEAK